MNDSSNPALPVMEAVWQDTLGWQPTDHQQHQFQQLYEQVLAGNQQLNLTRITEPSDFWEKHLWDSLRGIRPFLTSPDSMPFKVIDIGTGGGFPGIPVAIARPSWAVTLLDSTKKKIAFLNTLSTQLAIQSVSTLTERAEHIGQQRQHREQYDLALIRAVGGASVCAEYALPLVKVGGSAILYRGQWTDEEAESLGVAIAQLGGSVTTIEKFTTPVSQSLRHCLYLRKHSPTPSKFPRGVGVPAQSPL